MKQTCKTLGFLAWMTALSMSPAVHADDNHRIAEEKFRSGREAMNRGDCQRAIEFFRASNDLESGRGKIVNIAICEEKLGHLVAAARRFKEILPQLPANDDRRPIVLERLASLDKRVPVLSLRLPADAPAGTVVTFDGRAIDATAAAGLLIDPGPHTVVVSCPGHADAQRELSVEEGSRLSMTVALGPPLEAALPRERPAPGSGRLTAAYALGAVGIVGIGTGAVTGGLALGIHDSTEARCPTHTSCVPEVVSDAAVGKTMSVISTVAFAAGAVSAGVGVYLFLTRSAAQPGASGARLTVGPSGLFLVGDF